MFVPVNEAEGVIAPFWDQEIAFLDDCESWVAPEAKASFSQYWCAVILAIDRPTTSGPTAGLIVNANQDLMDNDRILFFASVPKEVCFDIKAEIDGKTQLVMQDQPGTGGEQEYEAVISGRHLETVELSFRAEPGFVGAAKLIWLGLASSAARERMKLRKQVYPSDWPGKLLPVEESGPIEPLLGLFFGAEDLKSIRRKARSPRYAPLVDAMRKLAAEAVSGHAPEDFADVYINRNYGKISDNFKRDSVDRWTPHFIAPLCALVGLIDQDPELMRYAARCGLAMAHCDTWVGGFMENFRGSRWHQRSFLESYYAMSCLMVWDCAGTMLAYHGRTVIRHAICSK